MAEAHLFELPAHVRSRWTERRAAQVRASIQRRIRRRRVVGATLTVASFAITGCLLAVFLAKDGSTVPVVTQGAAAVHSAVTETAPTQAAGPAASQAAGLRTSVTEPVATPLTPDTELVVDPEGGGRAFVLRQGSARFVVAHDEHHPFRVRVGRLVIEDLGTVFFVKRLSDGKFDIAVDEGHVAVLCGDARVEMDHGEQRVFECGEPESKAATHQPKASPTLPSAPKLAVPEQRPVAEETWRSLAERGQYGQAYDSLQGDGQSAVRDATEELLLAADTARLSGHPAAAVPYLRRVLDVHASDSRANLAAFTLGRVLLDELGKPAEAAVAFERARAPRAPLAEDALAREVEALARAGDAQRAHALALEYRQSYPNGRRSRVVAKFGGLE